MHSWQCEYTKTYTGLCEQQKESGKSVCYFHAKVLEGLLESDPNSVMMEMATITLD